MPVQWTLFAALVEAVATRQRIFLSVRRAVIQLGLQYSTLVLNMYQTDKRTDRQTDIYLQTKCLLACSKKTYDAFVHCRGIFSTILTLIFWYFLPV